MSDFALTTNDTATEAGREALDRAEQAFGFTPNLVRILSNAPAAAHGYLDLGARLAQTSLTPAEQQVVLLASSFENGCDYCMAAHSLVAGMVGLDQPNTAGLRDGTELPDARLNALRDFTTAVVRERGRVPEQELERFLAAGFTRQNVLEVVLGVAMKTLSNYTNHLAGTPLDDAFAAHRWTAVRESAAVG